MDVHEAVVGRGLIAFVAAEKYQPSPVQSIEAEEVD
jgi:hypothetical protein